MQSKTKVEVMQMYVEPWQEAINNEEIQDKYYARLTIKAGVK